MSTTKNCLLTALMLFLLLGSAHPGLTQENSDDTLAQFQQEGWKTVQSGVLQREVGEGEVETFVYGVPGFTWKIQDLRRQLQKLRAELRAHPTPELRKAIANHRKAIANARRALELAQEAEALGHGMVLPKVGCIDFVYDAAASYKTDVQGMWASANAGFRATCGSATGQAYAYAFAKTTVNGAETTETVTDGPRSGASVSASAYASRNGGSLCESRAFAEMVSYDLNPSSYSKEVTHSTCPPPGVSQPPVANFSFTCMDLACSFNGSASTGAGLTYTWSFGDSSTNGSGVTTSHFYPNVSGTNAYTVTLTVTDSLARQSSKSKTVQVTGNPHPVAQSYFTVAPCRVLDTRNTTILTNAQSRVVNIAGLCNIPSTAKAVSFNVTVISPTGSGKIRLYPGNVSTPSLWASSINFDPARSPRANSAVIPLATNGAGTLGIYPEVSGSPGQVHLVLDVQGYFSTDTSPASGAQGPLGFQTLTPCRIADTRPSSPLVAGTARTFTAQGVCGVPSGAKAVSLHVGVPGPAYTGYIVAYPSNIFTPGVSSINFTSGMSHVRNGAWVALSSTTPDFSALYSWTAGTSVHAYFDVHGYFKSDAPLKYYPITPCRVADNAIFVNNTTQTFQIQGNCGVPVGAKAAFVRLVAGSDGTDGDFSVYASNQSAPAISTVKFEIDEPGLSMGTIIPLSTLSDDIAATASQMTSGGNAGLSIDVFGYFQ